MVCTSLDHSEVVKPLAQAVASRPHAASALTFACMNNMSLSHLAIHQVKVVNYLPLGNSQLQSNSHTLKHM